MTPENVEWRLADFFAALAAEVDRAQDTVALKSFSRSLTASLKGLRLDLAVAVRVDAAGRILFRAVEPGQVAGTVLKLDLEAVTQGQVEEVSQPLGGNGLPLAVLPGITGEEVAALGRLSLAAVDDLAPYAASPALVAELARTSGVAEHRLRSWLGLPYIAGIEPRAGVPGQTAVIAGGNLGEADRGGLVCFPAAQAEVLAWSSAQVTVRVPHGALAGAVYAVAGGAATNTLAWAPADTPPAARAAARRSSRAG